MVLQESECDWRWTDYTDAYEEPNFNFMQRKQRWTEEQSIYIAELCEKLGPTRAAREAGRQIGRELNKSTVSCIHKRIMKSKINNY